MKQNTDVRAFWKRSFFVFALAVPAFVGCSSTDASGGGGNVNGGIGARCADSAGCAKGQTCRSDSTDWIAHHQCTTECSTDAECTGTYGNHTMCIGAHICVSKCLDDSNCPSGTTCNENGWCGNTGPGSGVPSCAGAPTPCNVLGQTDCATSLGCTWSGDCTGASDSCYSQHDSYSCSSQRGCYWSSSSSTCSGSSSPCSAGSSDYSCTSQKGCHWNASCSGTPFEASCQKISAALCKYTPGCTLLPQ